VVGTNDVEASKKFYDASLGALGIANLGSFGDNAFFYGGDHPEFVVTKPANGEAASHANGGTIGFVANSRAAVRAFHEAGVANGGSDEGAPGPRAFAPNAYGAYLRDPVGNKICAFCYNEGE
jgi:catechol 2,3-dioxygenase-like lactoylglutathione lyase family enzyme